MDRRQFLQLSVSSFGASALLQEPPTPPVPRLRDLALAHSLFFGTAVSDSQLHRPDFTPLLLDQCSILVPENQMKWTATHPAPDRFDFTQADFFASFAESNHVLMRGHNLCWHEHNPPWLEHTVTPKNAVSIFTNHVRTVASRYQGRMHSWDVVNEAIRPEHHNHHDLTSSIWLTNIGEGYIDLALRTARDADPQALLTYNDYDIETDAHDQQQKRDAVFALLRRMKNKGAPLDALGIQAHLRTNQGTPTFTQLPKFLKEIEKLNLQVFVTELDVDDQFLPADINERDRQVADIYRSFLSTVLPHKCVKAVLTWCLSDRDSWLQHFRPRQDGLPQRPLPFDAQLNAKPAFFVLRDAFLGVSRPAQG